MHEPAEHLLRLFELLVEDADEERLAEVVATARARDPRQEHSGLVERAGELALRLRRTLEERRRHESELAALFDTAGILRGCGTRTLCSAPSCTAPGRCWAPTSPT